MSMKLIFVVNDYNYFLVFVNTVATSQVTELPFKYTLIIQPNIQHVNSTTLGYWHVALVVCQYLQYSLLRYIDIFFRKISCE